MKLYLLTWQKKLTGVQTFNYGISGAAPIEILLRFQKFTADETSGPKKTFIYTFIDDHVRRHALTLPYTGRWGKWKPVFKGNGDTYQSIGIFKDVYPLKAFIYDKLAGSGIMRLIYPYENPPLSSDEKMDFINVIQLMEKQSQKLGGEFLVIIWPGVKIKDWVLDGLRKAKIKFLDLSEVDLSAHTKVPLIPVDLHPSPEGFAVVGDLLISELNLKNQSK